MNPKQLIIKCYAECEGGVWVALGLDFNLAAQGDSFEDAKLKLEAMIKEYVYDVLEGEDKLYVSQLLGRRAPISAWFKYYIMKIKNNIFHSNNHIFDETMPLRPA
jgi:hypothetical protein